MRALYLLPLFCAVLQAGPTSDRAAIHKTITRFNDPHQRSSVLTHDADLPPLGPSGEPGVSSLYFELKDVRFVTPDVAFVDAVASQYGSLIMKRSLTAHFVLRREEGAWRIALLRLGGPMP